MGCCAIGLLLLIKKAEHCSKNGNIKGESKYIKLMKYFKTLDETKSPKIHTLVLKRTEISESFSMIPETIQQSIHAFILCSTQNQQQH
jgi:hypothetical protein